MKFCLTTLSKSLPIASYTIYLPKAKSTFCQPNTSIIKNLAMSWHRGQDFRQQFQNHSKDRDRHQHYNEERHHHQRPSYFKERPRYNTRGQPNRPAHREQHWNNRRRPTQSYPAMSTIDQQLLNLRKKYKNTALIYLYMQTQVSLPPPPSDSQGTENSSQMHDSEEDSIQY